MSSQINIILNGKPTAASPGEYILDVARRHGIQIPTLCHDPRLTPYSSCYVCVVEVEGQRSLQPSCSTRVAEGMSVNTGNERVTRARQTALDLILSNHYADCVAPCRERCPAGVDVQGYIALIEKGLYTEAVGLIKATNPLPAICGRVCVRPCEAACRRNLLDEGTGVGIDYLKRFAADADLLSKARYIPPIAPSTGKKVAIIGAGPGGLSAAYFLQQLGHQCDIYEAQPHAGGWLRYGIPEYRLPNSIIEQEVKAVTELGVRISYGQKLGGNLSYRELASGYQAVILTIGSQRGTLLGCEGEDADGVFSGIDFLRNMEQTGQRYDFTGKRVVVVGGGNTAMDCCRTAIRCGSRNVKVVYRRTEREMPANPIEIHESKLEGVEYMFLTNPIRVNQEAGGRLRSITLIRMELGEPDASGRRRPVPQEGSEFELEVDYILAAIGQKTEINFLDDVNAHAASGQLKANRWGDIEADPHTLQTGIPSMFAAGDGVSGPATLIEAVAQAQIASRSCHQYLTGQEVKPPPREFLSAKDNFRKQEPSDYLGRYQQQLRQEMPVLEPARRYNFQEVELGYTPKQAQAETARCLECGCEAYFTCLLKQHADTYHADQKRFAGEHKEYPVRFEHPYIEIDANKCILCSRCIRICKEVVGANALTLVKRGFDTYVAPAMGHSLAQTPCESCGLCLSACPTGALTENVPFKPGPVRLDTFQTICGYCSVGCSLTFHHRGGFIMKVTGAHGMVNADGNLCMYGKFGYRAFNSPSRITKPLLREGERFREISFAEAYQLIAGRIRAVAPDQNAFFAGARLTNEEQYLVQKLARAGARTGAVSSFHYLSPAAGYAHIAEGNAPFNHIAGATRLFVMGAELSRHHPVVGYMVNTAGAPVEVISTNPNSPMRARGQSFSAVKSYYHFVRAANHLILSQGMHNALFIADRCQGFEEYRATLLREDFRALCQQACDEGPDRIEAFATAYNTERNAILIFSEREVCSATAQEIRNLALITGKLGKLASGIIALRGKNNSQGLFDMGIRYRIGVGMQDITHPEFVDRLRAAWGVDSIPAPSSQCTAHRLMAGEFRNLFVFGEDPLGTAHHRDPLATAFARADFVVAQDAFMSDTCRAAHLVLPASFWFETGGSFANSQRMIQQFEAGLPSRVEHTTIQQLVGLLAQLGVHGPSAVADVRSELLGLLPTAPHQGPYPLLPTQGPTPHSPFGHGCDVITLMFDREFDGALGR